MFQTTSQAAAFCWVEVFVERWLHDFEKKHFRCVGSKKDVRGQSDDMRNVMDSE